MADTEEIVEKPTEGQVQEDSGQQDQTDESPTEVTTTQPESQDQSPNTPEEGDKKEEPKQEEPEQEEPKPEESKQEEPKQEEPKQEEPKQEEPKQEEPKQEEPKQEEPKQEEPKQEEPKQEEPKQEEPKQEEPKQEEPKQEEPKQEEPKQDGDMKPEENVAPQTEGEEQKEDEVTPKEKPQRAPISISGKQIKQLLIGTEMMKAKKGRKLFPRVFYITSDLVRIIWNSKTKSVAKAQIPLSQIDDVLPGRQTQSFGLYLGTDDEDLCFSIIYRDGGRQNALDLIASTPEEADVWVKGLLALTGSGVPESTSEVRSRWLRALFDEADVNGDGTLDLKEIIRMMKRLNVGISQKIIKKKFKDADSDGNAILDFDEFCGLFRELSDYPEIRKLFNLHATAENGSYMTVDDFLDFVLHEQSMEGATVEYCQSIIEKYEPSEYGKNNLLLSLDGFGQYMSSDDTDIFKRSHHQVYQDMTQPLAHYFIASSHNTYLLEDQLSGPSSIDAYIRALKRGCRCVELDCWDGDDNEPIIYHGHTLTSKILFKDVIAAIKEYAFVATPYPLILSIENHCSVAQQHVMADYMSDILGNLLYKEPRNESLGDLPSPEELKYKILVKAKKLPKELEEKDDDDGEVSDEDEGADIDELEVQKVKQESAAPTDGTEPDGVPPEEPRSSPSQQLEVRTVITEKRKRSTRRGRANTVVAKPQTKRKLSSKLSKCVNYVQSVSFKGFEEAVNIPFYHMSSFGESSAFKHSENSSHSFIEYNKKHISRIYPSGRRMDSSNYEPVDMWNCGCQIVALNYQTPGKPMDWSIGKFLQNGNSGYILKPEIMREDFAHFNHKDRDCTPGISPKLITIRIIGGQQLPKPEGGSGDGEIIDPYVAIQFAGIPNDRADFKTKVINDNGFNPVWNETFTHLVTFPELCLIRFKVMDYDMLSQDDFIGQFTLPFTSIETGYRHIKLRTKEWEPIEGANIFVEVTIDDWVGPPPRTKEKLRLSKVKKSRQYPPIKPVSFPALDPLFRNSGPTLHTAINLKEDFKFALLVFKESCGKSSQTKIQDCIEALSSKAHAARVQLKITTHNTSKGVKVYQVEVAGETTTTPQTGVSGALLRIMANFDRLNAVILNLLNMAELNASELEDAYKQTLSQKDDFYASLSQPGVQPRRALQSKTIYSGNVRTFRNESQELRAALEDAKKVLQLISEAAVKCGIPIVDPPPPQTTTNQDEGKRDDQITEPDTKQEEQKDEPKEEPKEEPEEEPKEDAKEEGSDL